MYFNGKNGKNFKKYYHDKNKHFLNKKTFKQKEEFSFSKNKNGNGNDINEDSEYKIPGFYYDKNKNRYFSLKDKEIIKKLKINSNDDKIEQKLINTKNINNIKLSLFNMIHLSNIIEKKNLLKYYSRVQYLKNSNYINIQYEEDKYPNIIYLFFKNKYLLILDYSTDNPVSTSISIYDIINNIFNKKIIIEEFYNDFTILYDNLILIDNITKLSIINNINKIIESKDKKINIDITNKFSIKINNIERISMVYNWPFIHIQNNIYYYLLWNYFYSLNINDNNIYSNLMKFNNEIIYITKSDLLNKNHIIEINKIDIKKKYRYINFFINEKNFYLFTPNGEIHRYKFKKNNNFILKQIITNELLFNKTIIEICNYCKNNFLLISNQSNIYSLDLLNQKMIELNEMSLNDKKLNDINVKYKYTIFEYNDILNCIIYENSENIIIFSLDDFSEIKRFKIDNYKYNVLKINNIPKII